MSKRKILRLLHALLGWFFFLLGALAIFIPGVPTTIFWILAALAFARSNRAMYLKLVNHRHFGQGIRLFLEKRQISKRGKFISIAAMTIGGTIGLVLVPLWWVRALLGALLVLGIIWVLSLRMEGMGPDS